MIASLVAALGLPGMFGSRMFLPLLAVGLMLRFGPDMPWVGEMGALAGVGTAGVPTWYAQDWALLILGLASALEVAATKWPEGRAVLDTAGPWVKPAMAMIAASGFVSATDGDAGAEVGAVMAASVLSYWPVLFAGFGTFVVASARSLVWGLFADADPDDDVGALRLASWGEDLWALFGVWFLVLFPVVMLALVGLVVGAVLLAQWWAKRVEDRSRVDCVSCGADIFGSAIRCHCCDAAQPTPRRVNWLNVTTDQPADLDTHPLHLAAKRRCPVCAERLASRDPEQRCVCCGRGVFADDAFAERYDGWVSARVPWVLLGVVALGLVPVIGAVPAVVLYRAKLVGPYRRYTSVAGGLANRVALRAAAVVLIGLQWVPLVGGFTLPVLAGLNWLAYRRSFRSRLDLGEPASARPGFVSSAT